MNREQFREFEHKQKASIQVKKTISIKFDDISSQALHFTFGVLVFPLKSWYTQRNEKFDGYPCRLNPYLY